MIASWRFCYLLTLLPALSSVILNQFRHVTVFLNYKTLSTVTPIYFSVIDSILLPQKFLKCHFFSKITWKQMAFLSMPNLYHFFVFIYGYNPPKYEYSKTKSWVSFILVSLWYFSVVMIAKQVEAKQHTVYEGKRWVKQVIALTGRGKTGQQKDGRKDKEKAVNMFEIVIMNHNILYLPKIIFNTYKCMHA